MAVITPTVTAVGRGDGSTLKVQWTPVTEADTCAPVTYPECSDKSFQIEGTFGGSTTVLKGSNDGTNYEGLRDPGGTAISFTAAGLKAVLENTVFIQPVSSSGSSQILTITMLLHLTNPLRT